MFTWKTHKRAVEVKKRSAELEKGNVDANVKAIKPAQLDNYDIPDIVDGQPGYDIKKRPRSYCFITAKIFRSWLNIGFTPFPSQVLKNKKVRHMLGNGSTSEEMRVVMEDTQKKYEEPRKMVGKHTFSNFVFNSQLPAHKHDSLLETEHEQVAALLKGKSAFSAGGQWFALEFALLSSNAILRAQKEQFGLVVEETAVARAKKIKNATEKLDKSQAVLDKFFRKEKLLSLSCLVTRSMNLCPNTKRLERLKISCRSWRRQKK